MGLGDWDHASRCFTSDMRYQVGSSSVHHGPDGVRRYMEWQRGVVRWEGHTLRQRWNADDVVVIEVDSHFTRLVDGVAVTVPRTDIYQMSGLQIRDWRVYADVAPWGTPLPTELLAR